MKNVFLGVIACSLAILAAPTVIDAYKVTAKDIQTKHRAATRQRNAEAFCDADVIADQQVVFDRQSRINDLHLNGAPPPSWRRLATKEECVILFGKPGEYMGYQRHQRYPDA